MLQITSIAADLMRIFAQRHYNSDRYDDTIAIELMKYLQTLAHAEKVPTPKLDQYLAGEYPPVHMGCHIATLESSNSAGTSGNGTVDLGESSNNE